MDSWIQMCLNPLDLYNLKMKYLYSQKRKKNIYNGIHFIFDIVEMLYH